MAVSIEGQRLAGRYRVIDRLGMGGMASVYLCEDERLGRKVAVKRLHAETPGDTARRFRREAKLGASLNHGNVVSIFDAVPDEEGVLIVMEYVDGPNLGKLLQREQRLEPARALAILRDVAAALDYAHAEGIVHRDIKPANVLIASDGTAKLADLGIATALESTRITRSGSVLGTAAYMAPEQIDGAEPHPACDVYSLAAVAFECLSGHKARVGRTPVEIARRILSEPPPLLSDAWPEAPAEASEVLRRGMAREREDRTKSAGALISELETALKPQEGSDPASAPPPITGSDPASAPPPIRGSDPVGPPRATHRAGGRPPWLVPAAIVALLALVVVGALLLIGGDDGGDGDRAAQSESQDEPSARESRKSEPAPSPGESAPADPTSVPADSPSGAVQSFYERAASDDYEGAWELATPAFQAQLGGYDAFVAQQSTLESIEFTKLKEKDATPTSAVVDIHTVAHHSDRTERCKGSLSVVNGGSGWMVERADRIDCKPG